MSLGFKCLKCGMSYLSRADLEVHLKTVHGEVMNGSNWSLEPVGETLYDGKVNNALVF